jgi:hypothetical protein
MIIRRLVLVFSIVVCSSLALATAVFGAGGGLTPGQYSFNDTSANAFFGYGKGGPPEGFSVFVNRGINSFEPEDSTGGTTVVRSTMVQLAVYSATVNGFACYVIPESDFVVSSNLQSASLHTTLTTANLCKGFGVPATSKTAVAPLVANAAAAPAGGLPPTITLNVTWTGNGVTAYMTSKTSLECLDYSNQGSFKGRSVAAGAAGTISMLAGSFTTAPNTAVIGSSDSTIEISGYQSPSCPFGKG